MKEKKVETYFMKNSIINDYLERMKGTCSDRTFDEYEPAIKDFFFNFLNLGNVTDDDIRNVTTSDGNEWLYNLKHDEQLNGITVNKKAYGLQWFYKNLAMEDFKVVDRNPFSHSEGSTRYRTDTYSKGYRIPDEKLKLINKYFTVDRTWKGERNYISFLILLVTGMRISEVTNIKLGDFTEMGEKCVVIFRVKGGRMNMAEIPHQVKDIINSFVYRSGWNYTMIGHPLFTAEPDEDKALDSSSIRSNIYKAYRFADLPKKVRIHDIRHTYITKSLEQGQNIYDVAKRVGHAQISTTQRYDHSNRILIDNPAEAFYNEVINN